MGWPGDLAEPTLSEREPHDACLVDQFALKDSGCGFPRVITTCKQILFSVKFMHEDLVTSLETSAMFFLKFCL